MEKKKPTPTPPPLLSPKKEEAKILKQVDIKLKKHKTMSLSIKEGSFSAASFGLGNSYITPYALALKANNAQIGFLTSFMSLLSPLAQLYSSKLMEKFTRKKIIIITVILQALMWLPIISLSILFSKNIYQAYLPTILIIFYATYALIGALASPPWFSLMGDLVPEKARGRYFSKRNRITGTFSVLAIITGGFILDYFKTKGYVLIGFAIIFFIASITRLISGAYFTKHYEPKLKLHKGYYISFWEFLINLPKKNFGKFTIFITLMHFTVYIASPFFAVYMLKELQFSYLTYMIITLSSTVATLIIYPLWGRFTDDYGNIQLLRIVSILIPLIPILWLFSSNPYYLIFVPQLIGGVAWAGFFLSSSNFIYDSIPQERRALFVAYYNILNGVGIFLGAGLGGLLAQYLSITFMNKLLFIFLISGIARALIVLIFSWKIKEAKKTKQIRKGKFKGIKPIQCVVNEVIATGFSLKKHGWVNFSR